MKIFIKFLISLFFILNFAQAAPSTKEKINQTSKNLENSQSEEKELNAKIKQTADQILKEENSVKKRQNEIDDLLNLVNNLQEKFINEENEIKKLSSQNAALLGLQKDIENKIVAIISAELSFDLLSDLGENKSENSIVSSEILSILSKSSAKELNDLMKDYENNQNFINEQDKKIKTIKASMENYNKKKNELNQKQKEQEGKISKLKKDKDSYVTKLEKLNNEQEAIRKTLEELKIIDDKEEKAKAEKAEKERLAKLEKEKEKKRQTAIKKGQKIEPETEDEPEIKDERVAKINQNVKQYGSSYQSSRVKKYSGTKTISPLENPIVKRKFGNYSDPVYKIKIFNESITLASKNGDNKVKSVLPGKVVFAKETSVLDRVIIIEHSGGIHTIYAHLSQIAPTIKVGSAVKKGYIIGKISNDLTFEVTQKNYHINPLDLITLK